MPRRRAATSRWRAASDSVKIYRVGGSVRDELLGRRVVDRDWVVIGATPEILDRLGLQAGRARLPGLPPSRYGRGVRARAHRAQARARLSRLRVLRVARRHARRGPRAPRPDDQRDGARREGRAHRPFRRAGRSSRRHPAPCLAGLRRGSAARAARRALRRALRIHGRSGNRAADARAGRVRASLPSSSPERVWQELARGLMEPHPARLLEVLRECGALAELLPEVDALFGADARRRGPSPPTARASDRCARLRGEARVRASGALCHPHAPTGQPRSAPRAGRPRGARRCGDVRRAERISERLKVPVDCRDAARLAARWHRVVPRRSARARGPARSPQRRRCAAPPGATRGAAADMRVRRDVGAAGPRRFRGRALPARGARRS